jgi:glycosyltransferase involved in cell wall biosynthesis
LKKDRIKVLLIIPTLVAGGAERIMAFLAKNINKDVFDCTLIVLGFESEAAYDVKNGKVIFLNKSRVLKSIPSLINQIRKTKPHVVMSSVSHLNAVTGFISFFFSKTIFVGRQSGISHVSSIYNSRKKNRLLKQLSDISLRNLDFVICQSNDMLLDCLHYYKIDRSKLRIIHNPITDSFTKKLPIKKSTSDKIRFITVGRLAKVKGHIRLLDVLSRFEKAFTYTIIGDGPEKETILEKINSSDLIGDIRFIDYTNNVHEYLSKNDFFLQGSYTEGFPNALLESCAVGTPVIAFNVPGGTSEIIENGVNGFLATDSDEFLFYLNNHGTFDPLEVSQSVQKKFSKKIILEKYESFFQEVIVKTN